jgi:preprotein translocase subunit SecG
MACLNLAGHGLHLHLLYQKEKDFPSLTSKIFEIGNNLLYNPLLKKGGEEIMKRIISIVSILFFLSFALVYAQIGEKKEYFWEYAKKNPELAEELAKIYVHHPEWRDEMKATDESDAVKMKWILEKSQEHPKLAEKVFEWADKHPLRTEWLWGHPDSARWLISHPRAAEVISNHPVLAEKFANHPGLKTILKKNPHYCEFFAKHDKAKEILIRRGLYRAGKVLEKRGKIREHRGKMIEKRGEVLEEKGEQIGGRRGKILERKGERMQRKGERMQRQGERMQKKGEQMQKRARGK